MSSPPVFSWVRVSRSLVLCVCFVGRSLVFFLFAIVLSVLLRYTDYSDYLFGIFQRFFFLIKTKEFDVLFIVMLNNID
jgi:hypothetical protein